MRAAATVIQPAIRCTDEVRTVVPMSLVGSSAAEVLAQPGVQIGTKSAISAIKQVPGRVLIEINN
jgi:hypothetical protein